MKQSRTQDRHIIHQAGVWGDVSAIQKRSRTQPDEGRVMYKAVILQMMHPEIQRQAGEREYI